ncbi:hypothetical protein VTI28DRAFT_2820 [Corynascus sepedonium]
MSFFDGSAGPTTPPHHPVVTPISIEGSLPLLNLDTGAPTSPSASRPSFSPSGTFNFNKGHCALAQCHIRLPALFGLSSLSDVVSNVPRHSVSRCWRLPALEHARRAAV